MTDLTRGRDSSGILHSAQKQIGRGGLSPTAGSSKIRARPGVYIDVETDAEWWEQDRALHRARLVDALSSMTGSVAVLGSAVVLHGGVLKHSVTQAHVWASWSRNTRRHSGDRLWRLSRSDRRERLSHRPVVNHSMQIDEDALDKIAGLTVTDLDQTIVHAARFLPPDDALVAVDSLLAVAVGRDSWWRFRRQEIETVARERLRTLADSLRAHRGERGVKQAREIFAAASPLSESVWESELRRVALAAGYLDVRPQVEVATQSGVKWVDLGIPRLRRGDEIDGDVKYHGDKGSETRARQNVRDSDLAVVGFQVRHLPVEEVRNTARVLDLLDRDFGETRYRKGISGLWTPAERPRFA